MLSRIQVFLQLLAGWLASPVGRNLCIVYTQCVACVFCIFNTAAEPVIQLAWQIIYSSTLQTFVRPTIQKFNSLLLRERDKTT